VGKVKKYLSKLKDLIFNHKKISIPLIIVLLIVTYFIFPKGNKPILTISVESRNIVKTVSVTGDVDSLNNAILSFPVPGKLIYLGAKEGELIKKGQAIASLDQNDLNANYRQALQDFTAAKAVSDKYYENHNDTESYDQKIQRTAIDAAQNKAYDQMVKAQNALNNSTIYSPIDGILVSSGSDTTGVNITSANIFKIVDPTNLLFKMDVDQADIGKIILNQNVDVSLDSFIDKIIKLKVTSIDFVSHKNSSGGNGFFVKANISNIGNLRIGMSGNADIILSSKKNVLTVPTSSITDDNFVYLQKNNTFFKQKVEKGLDNDIDVEIISGLSKGDVVALDAGSVPLNLISK
jgi:RND family efflux transporter MFP subunit